MADSKISALPAATTPLAGTEETAIVQSGGTDRVTVANLTAGRNVEVASLGVGTSTLTPYRIHVAGSITGATTAYGANVGATVQSDVTGGANGYRTLIGTAVASFTVTALRHFHAQQDTIGAGSAVTTQAGFEAGASLIGATNNYGFFARNTAAVTAAKGAYGFRSDIDTATGGGTAWQSYMAGTAPSYFGGSVGIGSTSLTGYSFRNRKSITGATTYYVNAVEATVAADVTSTVYGYYMEIGTAASAFTLSTCIAYTAAQGTVGATSTLTNQTGFQVPSNFTSGTNNFAFVGAIAAGSNRWNLYMSGTAQNALAGLTRFGGVTVPVNTVDITGSLGRGAPVTKTTDFTLAATENWVISNRAATNTVTLPAASSWTGREVMFKTIQAQTLVSASSNVVPQAGGAAGTAILAGTAGNWCTLVSDSTNWVVMQGGGLL